MSVRKAVITGFLLLLALSPRGYALDADTLKDAGQAVMDKLSETSKLLYPDKVSEKKNKERK